MAVFSTEAGEAPTLRIQCQPLCAPSKTLQSGSFLPESARSHLHTSKIYNRPITSSWLTGLRPQHRRSDLLQKVVFKRKNRGQPSFAALKHNFLLALDAAHHQLDLTFPKQVNSHKLKQKLGKRGVAAIWVVPLLGAGWWMQMRVVHGPIMPGLILPNARP